MFEEPPIHASSRGQIDREKDVFAFTFSFHTISHSNLLLFIVVLFSLFWGEFYLLNFLYIHIYIWYMMPVVCKIYICMNEYILYFIYRIVLGLNPSTCIQYNSWCSKAAVHNKRFLKASDGAVDFWTCMETFNNLYIANHANIWRLSHARI